MKTYQYVVGIDPGFGGAIAIFKDGHINSILDMPVVKVDGKTNLNIAAIQIAFNQLNSESVTAVVEAVHAMPGQGVTSMFRFGYQLGVLHALIVGMGWNLETVTPQSWKKEFGLLGQPKEAALACAIKLFPVRKVNFERKKDIGRADAALIGLYAIRRNSRSV